MALWAGFLADYPLTRDVYFTVAMFHVLAEVPHLGVWINKQGWTPFRRERPYLNVAIEPSLGAPDALSDALGDWKRAQWLEPGEVRSWSITWRARRVPDEELDAGAGA